VNLAVHFIRARSSLILSCSFGSFLLYYACTVVGRGGKRELWGEKRWGKLT